MNHMRDIVHPDTTAVQVGPLLVRVDGPTGPFVTSLTAHALEAGVWLVECTLDAASAAVPPGIGLRWSLPCTDLLAQWRGDCAGSRGAFPPDWSNQAVAARACTQAPVICLHAEHGLNRLTFAAEDGLRLTRLLAGVREEDGTITCGARFAEGGLPAGRSFRFALRLDLRPIAWHAALDAVAAWWEVAHPPLTVPAAGREPVYSTWYSLHQAVEAEAVERQCRLARQLGCTAVIVDDGWQTLDGSRGYAYCGDWRPERIPDMAAHVARVHALGMKYLLWYSVPFIGRQAQAYARFAGRYLSEDERLQAAVLDPRFPEVRTFLVELYEKALRDWDLDGFKLDFVDAFHRPASAPAEAVGGRDLADVDEAVVLLLRTVVERLRAIKPDILIEFRQSYVGPVMRSLGNLFRAGDCPADAIGNRQRVLDIRALCRSTAAHADMLMWHRDEPVESAALQLLNVLFAVPQISVDLADIPDEHRVMLRFWLAWWVEHRACLLDGTLRMEHPEQRFSQASARLGDERIVCVYQDVPVRIAADEASRLSVVNVRREEGIILECPAPLRRRLEIRDACGRLRSSASITCGAGLHRLPVPPAGLAALVAE
jgi:alpha-galactosidase